MSEAGPRSANHRCSATRKDGRPCTAPALADGLCFARSPRTSALRTEARRTGGRNRSNAARLRGLVPPRLLPVFDQLEGALRDVLSGDLDPKQATAAAALARAMATVLSAGELEGRLRELEQRTQPFAVRTGPLE